MAGPALLEVENLTCTIGGVVAISGVDLDVEEHSMVGVVGPNGAGKTTFFNAVSGFVKSDPGTQIRWSGSSIIRMRPHKIANAGLMRTFQNSGGFPALTVYENLLVASRARDEAMIQGVAERLELGPHLRTKVVDCSLATRKLVGIAVAVVCKPRLLMLDEPLAGLDLVDRGAVIEVVKAVHAEGVTIVLIEHDVERTLALVDKVVVLDAGKKIAEGTPAELAPRPELASVYLKG
jgi:ABC-type branched-subunit amino acid transport system ATPase component